MSSQCLQGCRVFLVEDDFLIADDFARRLAAAGADVVGPAATLESATALFRATEGIDFAILDVNLRGVSVLPLASHLREQGVPFAFCPGYGDALIGDDFGLVRRLEKPLSQYGFATPIDSILSHHRGHETVTGDGWRSQVQALHPTCDADQMASGLRA